MSSYQRITLEENKEELSFFSFRDRQSSSIVLSGQHGQYKVVQHLDEGGFGTVLSANVLTYTNDLNDEEMEQIDQSSSNVNIGDQIVIKVIPLSKFDEKELKVLDLMK